MHELAVTESILNIAVEHAQAAGATRVTNIHLVIGQLSTIVDDSIQFYWDIITENTLCAESKLDFKRIAAKMQCLECNREYDLNSSLTPCPACGSLNVKIISGEEFFIESIDIDIA